MKTNMIRPYSRNNTFDRTEVIFNYRLSRARRVIENTFGILSSRFKIFRRPIIAHVETIKNVTKSCVALHNFLMKEEFERYIPNNSFIEMPPENSFESLSQQGSNIYGHNAKFIRDNFKDYFNSPEGSVKWQDDIINPF